MPGRYTRPTATSPTPAVRMYVDACAVEGHHTYLANLDDGTAINDPDAVVAWAAAHPATV